MIRIALRREVFRLTRWFSSSEKSELLNRENPFGENDNTQLKTEKINPTMTESFEKKFSDDEVKKYLDPMGFLKDMSEKDREQYRQVQEQMEEEKRTSEKSYPNELNDKFEEFGFKYQGKEPTRFGDWEHKGRCTDF